MNNKIINLCDKNFKETILKNKKLILVDFWAEWCEPCKIMSKRLNQILEEYQNKLIISKLDIDKNIDTAKTYNIRSIPSLILFKNGKQIDTLIGLVTLKNLKIFLNKYIENIEN